MSNYFIAGSYALHAHGFKIKPRDLDIFYIEGTKRPYIKSDIRVEYHAIPEDLYLRFEQRGGCLTPESMYILKLSHAEYDIHWQKTVNHIHMIKRMLKEFWKTVHKSKKRITLKMPKDKFFNNKVKRKYDHDLLHEIVKYNEEPM